MLRKFLKRFVPQTHYWRNLGFDELAEIYASQLLRSLALSLVNVFVPVYLYSIGYNLSQIFLFFFSWFVARLFFTPMAAFVIARIGPKHSILLSQIIQILYLSMLMSLKTLNWSLYGVAMVGSAALSLFWVAFHTDLSKVRHPDHAGKELSYVNVFERVGAIIGPLVGGLIANFFDPRYTIFLALVTMVLSSLPLLATKEPVRLKQKITFRGFPYKTNFRTSLASTAYDLDTQSCQIVWPLFVSIAVFGDNVFGKLGLMTALSVALGLIFTHTIGRLIDDKKGGELFRFSALSNAVVYLFRPFVGSLSSVFAINFINDPVTTGMRMPYLKGYHDEAENHEGYRIVFFAVNELVSSLFRAVFWAILFLLSQNLPAIVVMRWHFLGMSVLVLLIFAQKFPSLKKASRDENP